MILALLLVQGLDLITFLALAPLVAMTGEIGPIGLIYVNLGPLGALSFKLAMTGIILACCAIVTPHYPRGAKALLGLAIVGAAIGASANAYATWQITTVLAR